MKSRIRVSLLKVILPLITIFGTMGMSVAHETGTQLLVIAPGDDLSYHAVWNVEKEAVEGGETGSSEAAEERRRVAKVLSRFYEIEVGGKPAALKVVSVEPSDSGVSGYTEVLFTIASAEKKSEDRGLKISFRFPGKDGGHKLPPLKVKILDSSGNEVMGAVLTPKSPSLDYPGTGAASS